jgi:hypothetical protein
MLGMGSRRPVNRTEIRIVGMSRSGNHAIIEWVLSQTRGRTCFLNCAEPGTNPFRSSRPLSESEGCYRASYPEFQPEREAAGDLTRKDWLVHSYEDVVLPELAGAGLERSVGSSSRRLDLLILRDPFNLFASRLASGVGVAPRATPRVWCGHAREFLGETRYLSGIRLMVSYNRWAMSPTYRRELAERLGLYFDDRAAAAVSSCAGGSSFDGTLHDGRAHGMAVLDRWRLLKGDPVYRAMLTPEVLDLARRIFGPRGTAASIEAAKAIKPRVGLPAVALL